MTKLANDADFSTVEGILDYYTNVEQPVGAIAVLITELRKYRAFSALERNQKAGFWTYDPRAEAYYFAPLQRTPPPYKVQRHVTAILDIASDDTLAGVELVIGDLPPPPKIS